MCFECMESQLNQNTANHWKGGKRRPIDIEDAGGLYDYATTRADHGE